MPRRQSFLKPVMDSKGRWTGEYECALCATRFRPDKRDRGKLSQEFVIHAIAQHGEHEDFSEAAARIVREATED